jgi:hypothetical protein
MPNARSGGLYVHDHRFDVFAGCGHANIFERRLAWRPKAPRQSE